MFDLYRAGVNKLHCLFVVQLSANRDKYNLFKLNSNTSRHFVVDIFLLPGSTFSYPFALLKRGLHRVPAALFSPVEI